MVIPRHYCPFEEKVPPASVTENVSSQTREKTNTDEHVRVIKNKEN